jgi:hypothetical protein
VCLLFARHGLNPYGSAQAQWHGRQGKVPLLIASYVLHTPTGQNPSDMRFDAASNESYHGLAIHMKPRSKRSHV